MNTKVTSPTGQDDSQKNDNDGGKKQPKNEAGAADEGGKGEDDSDKGGAGAGDEDDPTKGGADDGGKGDDDQGGGDDWRKRLAGDDPDALKRLQRFASEGDVVRSLLAAERKLRSGGQVALPGEGASDEDVAKFYTEHLGRPEKAEDIKVSPTLPEGEELTEQETAVLNGVLGMAHKQGRFGQPQFDAMAQIVVDLLVGGRKEQEKLASSAQKKTEQDLRKTWGGDYDRNLQLANQYAGMRCEQAGVDPTSLVSLVLADGTRLGDHPLFARVMALGGRDFAEDPMMVPRDDAGGGLEKMRSDLKELMDKANSKDTRVRREYDSAADTERRRKLREQIARAEAGGKKR